MHDFASNTSWAVQTGDGPIVGLANDGTIVFESFIQTGFDQQHVYREVMGGTPQQLDTCVAGSGNDNCGRDASMSDDGNLIAYDGPSNSSGRDTIYLYNAATGSNGSLFSVVSDTADLDIPVLSADGTHIAFDYTDLTNNVGGVVVKSVTQSSITASDIISALEGDPAAVSDDGSTLVTTSFNNSTPVPDGPEVIDVYKNGATSTAPSLAYLYEESVSLTPDGSTLLYTLAVLHTDMPPQQSGFYNDYPGVYEWQIP